MGGLGPDKTGAPTDPKRSWRRRAGVSTLLGVATLGVAGVVLAGVLRSAEPLQDERAVVGVAESQAESPALLFEHLGASNGPPATGPHAPPNESSAKREEAKVGTADGVGMVRGLGISGSGSAGGGVGGSMGSIGTKGVGTVGYGRGSGVGYGAVGGRASRRSQLSQDVRHPSHNPTELAANDMLSTFGIDVDTGSYTQARRMLREGVLPAAAAVRTEEFVNYFNYGYGAPGDGEPFAVHLELAPHPWQAHHHVMRVGIQGAVAAAESRQPLHLTLLVDTSGSMSGSDRLPLAQKALHHLVENLGAQDTVALATYAGSTRVALPPTGVDQAWRIHDAISGLRNGGGTAMESGMKLAYDLAHDSFVAGHENRVVVLSDGDANIGRSSPESIHHELEAYAKEGITLSTIGFGSGNYRDAMMEQLADKGDGNYSYIDSMAEARRVFGEDLQRTLRTIAKDVKIQVEFNPRAVLSYKLIGYENRAIADRDFRNDAVDAGEIGAGHSVTALYDVVLRDRAKGKVAVVRLRHKRPGADSAASEQAVGLPARAALKRWDDSSADLRLAWAAASFAEKLRGARELEEVSWHTLMQAVPSGRGERAEQLVELIERADKLQPRGVAPLAQAGAGQ